MKTSISIVLIIAAVSLFSCGNPKTLILTKADTTKTLILFIADTKTGQGVVCNAFRVTTPKRTIDSIANQVKVYNDTTYYPQWEIDAKDSTGKVLKDSTGKAKRLTIYPPVDKKFVLVDYNKSFF